MNKPCFLFALASSFSLPFARFERVIPRFTYDHHDLNAKTTRYVLEMYWSAFQLLLVIQSSSVPESLSFRFSPVYYSDHVHFKIAAPTHYHPFWCTWLKMLGDSRVIALSGIV